MRLIIKVNVMTYYQMIACSCLAVALTISGQQVTEHLTIEFPTLQREVRKMFGTQHASQITALANTLQALEGKSVAAQLSGVNTFFDEHIQYASDKATFNQQDYWATPGELFGHARGDCEDYAIAKYVSLLHLGIESKKLRLIYVNAKIGRSRLTQAHMVLGYYESSSSDPLVLDSLVSTITKGSQRTDLEPVFSFNDAGIWAPGNPEKVSKSISRLSKWRDVIERMKIEGIKRRS